MPNTPSDAPRTTRREFLARTAALTGTGPLLACASAGDRRPVPKAMPRTPLAIGAPIRLGVIGVGGMGRAHLDGFLGLQEGKQEDLRVVAVADVCTKRVHEARELLAKKQGDVRPEAYTAHESLLARDDLHGVVIATPEHWHAQMAEDALAAGKDVYVEKPMTLRLDEALRLREVVRANPDLRLQVGTQYLVQERYTQARKLIAAGEIGVPTFSQTSYCRNSKTGEWNYYGLDPDWRPGENLDWERWCGPSGAAPFDPKVYARWRRYRRYSTGILGDLLVHMMTPLVYALDQGWPVRVVACGAHLIDKEMENHDQVNLTIQFESGHVMVVAGSTCNERGLEIQVRGNKGTLQLGSEDVVLRPERIWAEEVDEHKIQCKSGKDHDEIRLDWLRSIRTRAPNLSQVDLGTQVMVIVDLATRSLWEGKAFSFDPKTLTALAV